MSTSVVFLVLFLLLPFFCELVVLSYSSVFVIISFICLLCFYLFSTNKLRGDGRILKEMGEEKI